MLSCKSGVSEVDDLQGQMDVVSLSREDIYGFGPAPASDTAGKGRNSPLGHQRAVHRTQNLLLVTVMLWKQDVEDRDRSASKANYIFGDPRSKS